MKTKRPIILLLILSLITLSAFCGNAIIIDNDENNDNNSNNTNNINNNNAPVIQTFTAADNPLAINGTTSLNVTATDADGDTLVYNYEIITGDGILGGSTGSTETYTAPSVTGLNQVKVTVSDTGGLSDEASLDITVNDGASANQAPVITAFSALKSTIAKGETTTLNVTAADPDGDILTYTYEITTGAGNLGGSAGSSETYTAPEVTGTIQIKVTVTDPDGLYDEETLDIEVSGAWEYIGTGELTTTPISGPITAVNTSGTPYIAFQDNANSSGITVMQYTGNTTSDNDAAVNDGWEYVGAPNISGGVANDINLVIDASEIPYIAYRSSGKGHVKYFNGAWTDTLAGDFGNGWSSYISLYVESDGTPWIAYRQGNTGNNNIYVIKQNGAAWDTYHSSSADGITIDGITEDFTGSGPQNLSIVVDSQSKPYVVFKNATDDACVLEYSANNSTDDDLVYNDGWEFAGGISKISDTSASYITIDLDPADKIYVAYKSGSDCFIKKYSGTSWSTIGDASFTAGNTMAMTVDGSGNPYVVFHDSSNGPSVRRYINNSWEFVGQRFIESSSGFGLNYTSICIDGSGTPFITYSNTSGLTEGRVLKYTD